VEAGPRNEEIHRATEDEAAFLKEWPANLPLALILTLRRSVTVAMVGLWWQHIKLRQRKTAALDAASKRSARAVLSMAAPVASGWSIRRVGPHAVEGAVIMTHTERADIRRLILLCRTHHR
jgi:hypothetical protein